MKKLTLFLVIFLILTSFGSVFTGVAFAAAVPDKYTTVLEDLQKDETFDAAQFPAGDQDKMDVFQIAESNAGELFLYVYSPTGDKFTASDARISQSIGDNLHVKDKKLTLLSRSGTLSKYLVNDLIVKQDTVRYYLIIQIARPFDQSFDGEQTPIGPGGGTDRPINPGGGTFVSLSLSSNVSSTVPYDVGKLFTACTIDGKVTYSETHEEVIEITDKFVGFQRYLDGSFLSFKGQCDSHYVAFSTNRQIDKLFEADVSYEYQHHFISKPTNIEKWGDKKFDQVTLYSDQNVSNNASFWGVKHTWKRIESVKEFLEKEELDDNIKNELSTKQWVLRFFESNVTESYQKFGKNIDSTYVSAVTILRLKFETDGVTYNLGVVDNKQSGNGEPTNPGEDAGDALKQLLADISKFFENLGKWFKDNWWIFILIGALLILAILAPFFPVIAAGFKVVGKGIAIFFKYLGKALWWLIKFFFIGVFYISTSLYWIIRAIVKKCKGE